MKHIELKQWLVDNFDPPPHISTARRWIERGYIHPEPIRGGHKFYVLPTAIYQKAPKAAKRPTILDMIRHESAT